MRVTGGLLGFFAFIVLSPGCVRPADDSEEDSAGEIGPGVIAGNALAPNALAPNALAPNALAPNALAPNALAPNALAPNALAPNALSPEAFAPLLDSGAGGQLSRMLLKYLVGCALPPDQSFSHTWTDLVGYTHDEVYLGQLGLAPGWASGGLDPIHRQIVSACAAARTNYYGVQVEISMRSPHAPLAATESAELAAFPMVEGAFWGDLFAADSPHLRACYNASNVTSSRSWLRDCASGHMDTFGLVQCQNITIVGSCDSLCEPLDPQGGFYPSCKDPDYGVTDQVITTALPPAPTAANDGDLTVETTAPSSVTKGPCQKLTQTISVTNTGSIVAPSPIVAHTLGDGLALLGASTTAGSCSAGGKGLTCLLNDLKPGSSALITVAAAPTTALGAVSSTSFAIAGMGESDVSDNASTVTTQVYAPGRSAWETISDKFNGTPIKKGDTVWLTVVMKPGGLPPGVSRVWALGGHASFTTNGKTYTVMVPDSQVTFDPLTTLASAKYDALLDRWSVSAPKAFTGNVVVSAVAFVAPADLPGGINPVSVSMHFASDRSGIKPSWSWAAAVYETFHRDYNGLQIQPTDDSSRNPSHNADHAATPEAFRGFVRKGARGDGGTNYTGGRTPTKSGAPEIQSMCP